MKTSNYRQNLRANRQKVILSLQSQDFGTIQKNKEVLDYVEASDNYVKELLAELKELKKSIEEKGNTLKFLYSQLAEDNRLLSESIIKVSELSIDKKKLANVCKIVDKAEDLVKGKKDRTKLYKTVKELIK